MQTLLEFILSHPAGGIDWQGNWGNESLLKGRAKLYKPHTILCRQGDPDDRVFFIRSGWAILYRELSWGKRQIIDTPLRGDIVVNRPGFASLASVTEMVAYDVSWKELLDAISAKGILGNKITCSLARMNNILAEHLLNTGRRNAISRTAHFLLELEERLSLAGLSANGKYECPLTQDELADVLGMTTVHVSRTLGELRKANLVSFKARQVEILNRKQLVNTAGFDREYLM